ncbi:MAG TPA: hypothetical protein VEF03_08640 [Candidatus Binataceae bacterium]|nr:hypothetical protein [Candidatus Binataceae bacterium]
MEECKRWFDLAAARDELDRALGARREALADWQRIALDWNPVASPMPRWVESRLMAWSAARDPSNPPIANAKLPNEPK